MKQILSHFYKSVRYALHGLSVTFRSEQNFRIQCAAALVVILIMFLLPVRRIEQVFLFLVIVLVLVLELVNTAVEKFVDYLRPRWHEQAQIIKDILSGAVLIASLGALGIGILILFPYFF